MEVDKQIKPENKISSTPNFGLEKIPTLLAISTSVLYVLGFLVVTSYLASKGIYEQALISPKYIMAGALIAVIVAAYYFFVWRKVVSLVRDGIRWPSQVTPAFRIFLDTYYSIEMVFACCLVSAWIGGLLISNLYVLPMQLVLFFAAIFDLLLLKTGVYRSRRKTAFIVTFGVNVISILGFFFYGILNPSLFTLWSILLAFTIIGSVVISSSPWKSGEDKIYGVFYLFVVGVLGIVSFGATVYEHISPKFGGAEPSRVSVTLDSESNDEIRKNLATAAGKVYLVLDSDLSVTFRLGDDTKDAQYLRLDRKLVKSMLFERPPRKEPEEVHLANQLRALFTNK